MKNILISCAGRRVSLLKTFSTTLHSYTKNNFVYASDLDPSMSAACQFASKSFKLPTFSSSSYISELFDLIKKNNIGIIIPTIDTELSLLSDNLDTFKEIGCQILVSDKDFINVCRDKFKTIKFFNNHNIPTPSLIDRNNPEFPLFVKPKDGSMSKGILLINNINELSDDILSNSDLILMKYFSPLIYDEYTIDSYYSIAGKLVCAVPRLRIEIRGGEVSKSMTCKKEIYNYFIDKFSLITGARGAITFQFFVHKKSKELFGIEINPRFGGGYPLSFEAGANYPKYIIDEYYFSKEIPFFDDWKDELLMLRYDNELFIHK